MVMCSSLTEKGAEVNGRGGIHYAGAYWANGFHEDGLVSGLRAAEALLAGGPQ